MQKVVTSCLCCGILVTVINGNPAPKSQDGRQTCGSDRCDIGAVIPEYCHTVEMRCEACNVNACNHDICGHWEGCTKTPRVVSTVTQTTTRAPEKSTGTLDIPVETFNKLSEQVKIQGEQVEELREQVKVPLVMVYLVPGILVAMVVAIVVLSLNVYRLKDKVRRMGMAQNYDNQPMQPDRENQDDQEETSLLTRVNSDSGMLGCNTEDNSSQGTNHTEEAPRHGVPPESQRNLAPETRRHGTPSSLVV